MIPPLVIGDSLTVGAQPYLPAAYHVDARVGRPSAEGVRRLRRHGKPDVLVWALGTNDSYASFARGLRVARRRSRRLVVVTIHGVPAGARMNRLLRRKVPARCVVHWNRWADHHRRQLAGDGVHGTPRAYRVRALLTTRAVRACSS